MTDKELDEFIYVGENKFIELAMIFGDVWPSKAIQIAAEYKALLAQPDTLFVTEFNSKNYLWWKDHNGKLKHAVISKPEETVNGWPLYSGVPEAIEKLKGPFVQPKPEPNKLIDVNSALEQAGYVKKKEWVGLTDKEVVMLAYQSQENECTAIRLAEQALKEKNT